jgi:hypothetical protein
MFSDLDSDIQTRIPDRPARKVPVMISQMPAIPWLASKYEPRPSEKPSFKTIIDNVVRTGIPLLGAVAIIAVVIIGALKLSALY